MKWRAGILAQALLSIYLLAAGAAQAQSCPPLSAYEKAVLAAEHLFGGRPSPGAILIRRGYVTEYDAARRVPRWAAWHAVPAYLDTPNRKGRWARFRADPDIARPVKRTDYNGLFRTLDLARGHIVPYFIAGGDRDGDGKDAEIETAKNLPVEDIDDACTVFEVNYMSNIAPQFQSRFNGAGGLWFALETKVRKGIVGRGRSIHVIAGTVLGDAPVRKVGPDKDIFVPQMFYKILIAKEGVAAFLFVHEARIGAKGCALDAALESCIVTVRDIETVTGLDFFAGLDDKAEAVLEGSDGRAVWRSLLGQ